MALGVAGSVIVMHLIAGPRARHVVRDHGYGGAGDIAGEVLIVPVRA